MIRRATALAPLALALSLTLPAFAQDSPASRPTSAPAAAPAGAAAPDGTAAPEGDVPPIVRELMKIKWQEGPGTGSLGDLAEIKIPEGFVFADGVGTRRFLELNENPTNGDELGMIAPANLSYSILFEFSDIGYVKDEEKAELDAEKMLESLREGGKRDNEVRSQRGWATLTLVGWAQPPNYEPTTHNLEWGLKLKEDRSGHTSVNHNIRILGRSGVMEATLLASTERYTESLAESRTLLGGYTFKAGQKYSEWKPGEKIAQIGLVGLVTGGAVAAAAKTGLLGKLGKGVIKLVAVAGAAIATLFGKLFNRKKGEQSE